MLAGGGAARVGCLAGSRRTAPRPILRASFHARERNVAAHQAVPHKLQYREIGGLVAMMNEVQLALFAEPCETRQPRVLQMIPRVHMNMRGKR
jgi:hypothetical protein